MSIAAPISTSPAGFRVDIDQLIGLALVAGLPTLFWSGTAFFICAALGITLTATGLAVIATSVAAFLGVIYYALRNSSDT